MLGNPTTSGSEGLDGDARQRCPPRAAVGVNWMMRELNRRGNVKDGMQMGRAIAKVEKPCGGGFCPARGDAANEGAGKRCFEHQQQREGRGLS